MYDDYKAKYGEFVLVNTSDDNLDNTKCVIVNLQGMDQNMDLPMKTVDKMAIPMVMLEDERYGERFITITNACLRRV